MGNGPLEYLLTQRGNFDFLLTEFLDRFQEINLEKGRL